MQQTAWLIGDDAEAIMNDLTAPNGYPPAQVWVPLDVTLAGHASRLPTFRSAWGTRTIAGEEWVDFEIPGATIAEAVGPEALVDPKTLAHGRALASNMRERDGILMVKVPRLFASVCTQWSYLTPGDITPSADEEAREWTVASLSAVHMWQPQMPSLIIMGSVARRANDTGFDYFNAGGRTTQWALKQQLRELAPMTLIRRATYTPLVPEIWL